MPHLPQDTDRSIDDIIRLALCEWHDSRHPDDIDSFFGDVIIEGGTVTVSCIDYPNRDLRGQKEFPMCAPGQAEALARCLQEEFYCFDRMPLDWLDRSFDNT